MKIIDALCLWDFEFRKKQQKKHCFGLKGYIMKILDASCCEKTCRFLNLEKKQQ